MLGEQDPSTASEHAKWLWGVIESEFDMDTEVKIVGKELELEQLEQQANKTMEDQEDHEEEQKK